MLTYINTHIPTMDIYFITLPCCLTDFKYQKVHIAYNYNYVKESFLKKYIFLFFERERKGEREGEKHQCVVVSRASPTQGGGSWPTTQACALTGNQTGDPLVRRSKLNH